MKTWRKWRNSWWGGHDKGPISYH